MNRAKEHAVVYETPDAVFFRASSDTTVFVDRAITLHTPLLDNLDIVHVRDNVTLKGSFHAVLYKHWNMVMLNLISEEDYKDGRVRVERPKLSLSLSPLFYISVVSPRRQLSLAMADEKLAVKGPLWAMSAFGVKYQNPEN